MVILCVYIYIHKHICVYIYTTVFFYQLLSKGQLKLSLNGNLAEVPSKRYNLCVEEQINCNKSITLQ